MSARAGRSAVGPPAAVFWNYRTHILSAWPRFALLASVYPGVLTSFWRSPEHNASVGGSPNSQHLVALAFDFVPDDWAQAPAFLALAQQLDLVALNEGDHIHVQRYRAGTLRIDV